jgi:hypothetical protein
MAMTITAEQAAEAARGLTFEKVWAALMESRERQEKAFAEMKQSSAETDRQLKETFDKVEKSLDRTAKQVGDLSGSVGRITEEMFAANLKAKFDGIYNFTKGGPQKFWNKNGSTAAQVDVFLENGEYAMAVEMNYCAAEPRGISPFPALVYFLSQQERDCRWIGNLFYRICFNTPICKHDRSFNRSRAAGY